MTANVPALVAEQRQEIVAAQARGDVAAANRAYSMELQALAEAARGTGGLAATTDATAMPAPALLPAERCESIIGALAAIEPEGAVALRRDWPGSELAANLAWCGWTLDRYAGGHDTDSEMGLFKLGLAMAKQIYFEVHPGETNGPAPLRRETVNAFLAEYPSAEAEVIRRWQGGDLAANLGFLSWMLRTYGGGITLDSEANMLRLGAAIGRGVHADLNTGPAAGRAATSTQGGNMEVQAMTANEFDDALDLLRQEQREQQALGNMKRANRAMAQEFALIEARQGGARPVVGSGQRYA